MSEEFRTPQSANEALLQNILGAHNETRVPQSVVEYYLKLISEKPSVPTPGVGDTGKAVTVGADGAYTLTDLGIGISYEVVESLPSSGEAGVIYLVSNGGLGTNIYDEYIWTGTAFEKIGSTEIPQQVLCINKLYGVGTLKSLLTENESAIIAAAEAGKLVILRIEYGTNERRDYFLTRWNAVNDISFSFLANEAYIQNNPGTLSSPIINIIVYKGGANPTVATLSAPILMSNDFKAEGGNLNESEYTAVRKQTSTAAGANTNGLYVPKVREVPDSTLSDENKVLRVEHSGGVLWGYIRASEETVSYSDIIGQPIYYAVQAAKQNTHASFYLKGSTYYEMAAMLMILYQADTVTNVFPHITIGDMIGNVLYSKEGKMAIEAENFDITDNTFVKVHLVVGVDDSGGVGNEEGYFCIHAEAYSCSAFPTS